MRAWHNPSWASFEPGNRYVETLYDELPMPTTGWSGPLRQKWDVEGKPSDPERGFLCSSQLTLRQLVRLASRSTLTASASLFAAASALPYLPCLRGGR